MQPMLAGLHAELLDACSKGLSQEKDTLSAPTAAALVYVVANTDV
jgi:hypothetical protein